MLPGVLLALALLHPSLTRMLREYTRRCLQVLLTFLYLRSLSYTYTYPDDKAGSGVDIYVVGMLTMSLAFMQS